MLLLWWVVAVMTFMVTIIVPPMLMLLRSPTAVFVRRDDPGQDCVDGFEVRASSSVDVHGPWSWGACHQDKKKNFG